MSMLQSNCSLSTASCYHEVRIIKRRWYRPRNPVAPRHHLRDWSGNYNGHIAVPLAVLIVRFGWSLAHFGISN
jgi:hypothetical protein